jgi:hypothetical protein
MPDNQKLTCIWSRDDEAKLVQAMMRQKELGNFGDNNPRKIAWTACETALAGSEIISGGAAKNIGSIKNRWQRVHIIFLSFLRFTVYMR